MLDDVQYVKGSWINRNRIRMGSEVQWFTAPVQRASSSARLNDIRYADNKAAFGRLAASLRTSYARTAGGPSLLSALGPIIKETSGQSLVAANVRLLQAVCALLNLPQTPMWHFASRLEFASRREQRIAAFGKYLGAQTYINLPGGRSLYSQADFGDSVELRFISIRIPYRQPIELSIVDRIAQSGVPVVSNIVGPNGYVVDT